MLKFFGQLRFFSKFSPFLHSATKTIVSCRCYRRANLDAWCCTEQRGGCFQRVYSVEKGVMIHKQHFSGSKNLLFPFSITIIPIGFLCLQLLPSRQIQNAAPRATAVLSPHPRVTTVILLQRRRETAMGHKKQPPWATARSQPKEGAEVPVRG